MNTLISCGTASHQFRNYYNTVLGLARTGLIFTGLQEGAQPGGWGLTPPGQTEPAIPYHVTSRWVPGEGAVRREITLAAWERAAPVRSKRAGLFLSCFLLICIVVVPVSLCLLFC